MGQIQSAINAGIGSIIGAKAMAEHLQGQALNAIEGEYAEAKDIGKTAEKLIKQTHKQAMAEEAAQNVIEESNKKLEIQNPRDEKTGRFVNKKEYQRKLDNDIEEANKALFEVHKQQQVTVAQKEAFKDRLAIYNTRQGLIQKSLDRLPAKNRPESPDINRILTSQQLNAINAIKENR